MKPFKPNQYKKFKLKTNNFRDFQTFKQLKPQFHSSVLVFKLGQKSKLHTLILNI